MSFLEVEKAFLVRIRRKLRPHERRKSETFFFLFVLLKLRKSGKELTYGKLPKPNLVLGYISSLARTLDAWRGVT